MINNNQTSIARHIRGENHASLECSPEGNNFVPVNTYSDETNNDESCDEDDIEAFRQTIMGSQINTEEQIGRGRNGMIYDDRYKSNKCSHYQNL